jgi:hypothetical protein
MGLVVTSLPPLDATWRGICQDRFSLGFAIAYGVGEHVTWTDGLAS